MTTENEVRMIDVYDPESVEIEFSEDARTLWVNVDGICRLRAKMNPQSVRRPSDAFRIIVPQNFPIKRRGKI